MNFSNAHNVYFIFEYCQISNDSLFTKLLINLINPTTKQKNDKPVD